MTTWSMAGVRSLMRRASGQSRGSVEAAWRRFPRCACHVWRAAPSAAWIGGMITPPPNLGDCLPRTAPGKIALIDAGDWDSPRQFTYAELDAAVSAVGRALRARGLGPGARIGILALNRWEYL